MVPLAADNAEAATYGDFEYRMLDGTIRITGYTGSGDSVAIPNEIEGVPVTSIGDRVFYYQSYLTSIIVPVVSQASAVGRSPTGPD